MTIDPRVAALKAYWDRNGLNFDEETLDQDTIDMIQEFEAAGLIVTLGPTAGGVAE